MITFLIIEPRRSKRPETGGGFNGDSWRDYFGDSTVYRCGKSDFSVHLPCDSKPEKADRGENCAETEDSGGLEQDHERDSD